MHTLTLALWQTAHPRDSDEALLRLDAAAARARAGGARLLVTPEMYLGGYLVEPRLIAQRAQPVEGPLIGAVGVIARRHRLAIVTGWPETDPPGLPYNSAVAVDEDGRVRAVHRKIHLFGQGDVRRFAPGADAPALFEWHGWRLGLLICFDVEHDAPLQDLAARGAHAVLVPTANMAGYDAVQQHRLPEAARRFGLAIAYANACGAEGDTTYNGWSTACAANGSCLGMAGRDEALLVLGLQPPDQ